MNLYKITSYYWCNSLSTPTLADKVTEEHYIVAPSILEAFKLLPEENRVLHIDILVNEHDLGKLIIYGLKFKDDASK